MLKLFVKNQEPVNHDEISTLFSNLELILNNTDKILSNDEYFNIHIKGTGICGIFIGYISLYLGDLLILWQKGIWKRDQKYYYHVGGSPLSGMSVCNYWSDKKGLKYDRNNPSFGTLFHPASKVLRGIDPFEKECIIPIKTPRKPRSQLTIYDLIEKLSTK